MGMGKRIRIVIALGWDGHIDVIEMVTSREINVDWEGIIF